MPAIDIRTPLPGPNSQAVLARRAAAVSSASYYSTPVVAARAHGATVTDVDGNTFLDFTAGIGTLNVGHTPAEVAAYAWRVCELIQRETNTPAGAKIEVLNVSDGGLMPRPE